jgi:subtilase family serine protease
MRPSAFVESDIVGSSDSGQAHDGMFYSYMAAYYQNKFVDRMGVSVAAPTISQTITDAEITAAETILLEYLFDKIDKTPVLGHTVECTGTSVTLWTGDIRYKSLAVVGAQIWV